MAGTRGTRGARGPDVEELRFDFAAGEDHAREPVPVPAAEVTTVSTPLLSVVADEPPLVPGSVSDAALSVSDFYNRVRGALFEAFPGEVWVTGEICKVTQSRGHRYLELADHTTGPNGATSAQRLATRTRRSKSPAGQGTGLSCSTTWPRWEWNSLPDSSCACGAR